MCDDSGVELSCFGVGSTQMATYGLGSAGHVPFTGYTNTHGVGAANADATSGYVWFNGIQQGDDRIVKMLRNGGGTIAATRILYALLGAAPGALAAQTKKQIKWESGSPGGLIPIETINIVNRNTNAADLVAYQALISRVVQPSVYPPDLSGNGGGGKQAGGAY
jgi:hypothetical protein